MRALLLASLLITPVVLADVGMRNHGAYVGPVRDIDCAADGGLSCTRDSGVAIARIRCMGATATEPGCLVPSAQTLAGNKTWTGWQRHTPVAHASLQACPATVSAGTWQSCSTHGSPVFCDGTANQELLGATNLSVLPGFYVNGLLHSKLNIIHTYTLPFAHTITQTSGLIGSGTGAAAVLNIRYSDGSNNCDCPVDCDSEQYALTCSGNCSFAASAQILVSIVSDACTSPPTVHGLLTPAGYY